MSTITREFTKEQLIEDLRESTQNPSGMFEIGEETICGLMSLLTAPPAPVAVPDEVLARLEHEANHLTAWHHIDEHSCKVYRRDLLTLVNACRAATIQGADGNSPVIPDGWVMVPVEPTSEMYDAGDRQLATKQVWDAMVAAAPQQEVK